MRLPVAAISTVRNRYRGKQRGWTEIDAIFICLCVRQTLVRAIEYADRVSASFTVGLHLSFGSQLLTVFGNKQVPKEKTKII